MKCYSLEKWIITPKFKTDQLDSSNAWNLFRTTYYSREKFVAVQACAEEYNYRKASYVLQSRGY